ncbi:MAG: YbaN family protein [Filomicrobium sp.]
MLGRTVWLGIGLAATALGILGVLLPLLPTTPFMLVAAYAFARSSPALHQWLTTHPRFGPAIHAWQAQGAISRKTKIGAVLVMACSLIGTAAFGASLWIIGVQAIVLTAAATFVLTRPEPRAETD